MRLAPLVFFLLACSSSSGHDVSIAAEKRSRSAAQRKIDSQLLYALYRERGEAEAKGVPSGDLRVQFDEKKRALVTIRANLTPIVTKTIRKLGGMIESTSAEQRDIRAHLALSKLEQLAALADVIAILPLEDATTNHSK